MSKKQTGATPKDEENEDIAPEQLIDTAENKPKLPPEQENKQEYRELEYKNVSKLTDDEKDYLINLYKNGGEHDLYKVYFYRNGTNKIVRKKQPPKYNTTKRLLEQEQLEDLRARQSTRGQMSTEQILMEHVIDLEAKYATLYQKHKKLKKRTKELQEDLYYDENDDKTASVPPKQVNQEQQPEQEQEQQPQPQQLPETSYNVDQDNYINRLRRPQKGYRRMMAGILN